MKDRIKQWLNDDGNKVYVAFVGLGFALFVAFMCSSCAPKVITEIHTQVVRDTTTLHDSIYIDKWHTQLQKGDTIILRDSVFVYKYKYLDKVKEVIVRDSIPYTVEVEKIVKKRSAYDKFCSRFFWGVLVALLLVVAGWVTDKIYGWTKWFKIFKR